MEWLKEIAPGYFTVVFLRRICTERETLYAYLYLLTGIQPGDKLPSSLDSRMLWRFWNVMEYSDTT